MPWVRKPHSQQQRPGDPLKGALVTGTSLDRTPSLTELLRDLEQILAHQSEPGDAFPPLESCTLYSSYIRNCASAPCSQIWLGCNFSHSGVLSCPPALV